MSFLPIAFAIAAVAYFAVVMVWPLRTQHGRSARRSVALVVLGDIGRSPRMVYHAQSFANAGFKTYILAYKGSTPPQELTNSPLVEFVYLPTPLGWVAGLPKVLFLLFAPCKVVVGAWGLLHALLWRVRDAPGYVFVQNPPAIPTLPLATLAAKLRGSRLVVDWHNTGYSILALRLGHSHPVVRIARWIEHTFGRNAYAHLCVTEAMKSKLMEEVGLSGKMVVFHDRPPASFRRQTVDEAHDLFSRLAVFSRASLPASFFPDSDPCSTPFSKPDGNAATLLFNRPALLVSATSWTADEDFSILLTALASYEVAALAPDATLPNLVVVVTGKGALKSAFEADVARLESGPQGWQRVRVRTAWLERADYPRLLGSADLGLSLHASTSGADLPMKVVDCFGCGLPVCALGFECVDELIKDGVNGRVFVDAGQLVGQLAGLLVGGDGGEGERRRLRRGIEAEGTLYAGERWGDWETHWGRVVRPLL